MVLQGPRPGVDSAVLAATQDDLLAVTSDPITFTDSKLGHHLLAINSNDLATAGAYPRFLVLNLLFPIGTREETVRETFRSVGDACRDFEITLIGGHTEITDAVTRTVVSGTLIGLMKKDRRVDPSRTQALDSILLIGPIAVEGTAILARERKADVVEALGADFQRRAESLLESPGICIRDPALFAAGRYVTNALHDPTEGGLATALRELSQMTGHGVEVDRSAVEVLPETETLCRQFGLDPFGLLASGSLLAVLPGDEARRLSTSLEKRMNLSSRIIGRMTAEASCLWHDGDGVKTLIPEFSRDEILRALETKAK